ncbi:hypothetical protein [Paenibacillus campi]|uniref:hypothetical protein n=1 Tax=Paenibacillus campi TaxID=3106031 RepID=UPI002AFF2661|nr:hypothetical protein [Paenibacillus sp. SGZ-1014]
MQTQPIFPPSVREVIDFIEHGALLSEPYQGQLQTISVTAQLPERYGGEIEVSVSNLLFTDLQQALDFYGNEDVEPPYYFLLDMTVEASGDIPAAATEAQKQLARALIEYEEERNFYNLIKERIAALAAELQIEDEHIAHVADIISGDLYQCAKARLLLEEPHPYFEQMLTIYQNQGMPVGWFGSERLDEGQFIIYAQRFSLK